MNEISDTVITSVRKQLKAILDQHGLELGVDSYLGDSLNIIVSLRDTLDPTRVYHEFNLDDKDGILFETDEERYKQALDAAKQAGLTSDQILCLQKGT